jgi:hypothetical protein
MARSLEDLSAKIGRQKKKLNSLLTNYKNSALHSWRMRGFSVKIEKV